MTTPPTTLADFLLERIAEDEAAAREATPGPWTAYGDGVVLGGPEPTPICRSVQPWNFAHLDTFGPARVLAECEAKRRIVERQRDYAQSMRRAVDDCPDLLALAQPYSDHPNFKDEWRA